MGIGETHYFWIFCDVAGCGEVTDDQSLTAATSESNAAKQAEQDGWTKDEQTGQWCCPNHTPKGKAKSRGGVKS